MAAGSKIKDAAGNVGTATNLTPSLVQRVSQGVRYMVSGVKPNDWFGPSQPIEPVAQEAEGRVLDYPVGYNLYQNPRQETEAVVGFHELRALSYSCDILRAVIETRKDQISRLAWNIKVRDTGKKPSDDATPDPRLKAVEDFFRFPDKEHDWPTWLRMVVEDWLVIDAPAIYRRKDAKGAPYAFNVLDGATIKRVIDQYGLTPAPPSPAYQQRLHGLPAVDYTTEQLLYIPRNPRSNRIFGFSPVEQVVMTVNIALRRAVAQLSHFTEGNIPEALISCPPDWRPSQIKEMQAIFDDMLRGNLAERSGAKFIPGGLNVQFTKESMLKDDFDEWLARVICFAFSIAPTPFIKAARSGEAQKSSHDAAIEEGLAPLQMSVKNMIDRLLAEDFNSPDLEFVWYDDTAADPLVLAQVNQIYVNSGIKSRNEVRGELGLDPIPDGNEITITTGTGVTRLADALEPPEPAPMMLPAPHPETQPGDKPTQPGKESDKTAPKKPKAKKKDLTKADDPEGNGDDTEQPEQSSRERDFTILLAAALRRQGDTIAAKIAGTEHTGVTPTEEMNAADKAGAFDLDTVFEETSAILQASAADAAQDALADLKATVAENAPELVVGITDQNITSLVNRDAVDFANRRAAELIGKKLVGGELVDNPDAQWAITETTRDGIRKLVQQAEAKGQSVKELADEIRKSALFSPERANLIAITELSFSANNGNLIAWKRSGVVSKKRWILGSEHVEPDECNDNADAGPIDLDEDFPSGDLCPPQHPSCFCSIVPIVKFPSGR